MNRIQAFCIFSLYCITAHAMHKNAPPSYAQIMNNESSPTAIPSIANMPSDFCYLYRDTFSSQDGLQRAPEDQEMEEGIATERTLLVQAAKIIIAKHEAKENKQKTLLLEAKRKQEALLQAAKIKQEKEQEAKLIAQQKKQEAKLAAEQAKLVAEQNELLEIAQQTQACKNEQEEKLKELKELYKPKETMRDRAKFMCDGSGPCNPVGFICCPCFAFPCFFSYVCCNQGCCCENEDEMFAQNKPYHMQQIYKKYPMADERLSDGPENFNPQHEEM